MSKIPTDVNKIIGEYLGGKPDKKVKEPNYTVNTFLSPNEPQFCCFCDKETMCKLYTQVIFNIMPKMYVCPDCDETAQNYVLLKERKRIIGDYSLIKRSDGQYSYGIVQQIFRFNGVIHYYIAFNNVKYENIETLLNAIDTETENVGRYNTYKTVEYNDYIQSLTTILELYI